MRYRIPLGPFHPAWPGILRLDLEVEDGVVRAAEALTLRPKLLQPQDWVGLSLQEGLLGVERLCAASAAAYTLAYCQALETLAGLEVPPRARFLRVLLSELERVAAHLSSARAVLQLSGAPHLGMSLLDLREDVLQAWQRLTGRRVFAALNVPGGLCRDIVELGCVSDVIGRVKGPLYRLSQRVVSSRPVAETLIGAGLLTKERAEAEGMGGPVVRASEWVRDLRRDQPYAAYGDLDPQVVTQSGGDAFARWVVLVLEIFESLRLLEVVVANLPDGPVHAGDGGVIPPGEAQSRVEAPAGPLVVRVRVDEAGRLAGLWRTPPSPVHLAVLPQTLTGQRLDLIGVIVASWGLCSACLVR